MHAFFDEGFALSQQFAGEEHHRCCTVTNLILVVGDGSWIAFVIRDVEENTHMSRYVHASETFSIVTVFVTFIPCVCPAHVCNDHDRSIGLDHMSSNTQRDRIAHAGGARRCRDRSITQSQPERERDMLERDFSLPVLIIRRA